MSNQQQDAPLEYYCAKYREIEPQEAARRGGIAFDSETGRFSLKILGYTIYAEWPEFALIPQEPEYCLKALYSFPVKILVIRYILEGAAAPPRGGFKAYRELPWGEVYDRNFQGRCVKRLAFTYSTKLNEFEKACTGLGGVPAGLGDKSFDLPFFESVICRLILWGSDDEFPPSAQFLFSDNTPLAFNAEDLAGAGDIIINALKEISARNAS